MKVENTRSISQMLSDRPASGSPPTYAGHATEPESSTRTGHVESEHGEFGTIVDEVTVVTTTTRKRYRVEDT